MPVGFSTFGRQALQLAGLGLLLAACGGGATAGAAAPSGATSDLEALQRDFDASAARLAEQLQRRRGESAIASNEAEPASPKDVEEKSKADDRKPAENRVETESGDLDGAPAKPAPSTPSGGERGASYAGVGGSCDLLCRALASMRRSADGICSLTGEQHERCSNARTRLDEATRQVKDTGCICSS